ncbi:OpgC domain-containing protein, partial [Rhizobium sp. Pop5]
MASTPTEAVVTGRSSLSAAAPARDTRLDVLRGLALIMIFINHVPGQIFEYATTKNFGFSDAAEAFVLISGIAVGLAYGSRFETGNR